MSSTGKIKEENVLKSQGVLADVWINSLGVKKCNHTPLPSSWKAKEFSPFFLQFTTLNMPKVCLHV